MGLPGTECSRLTQWKLLIMPVSLDTCDSKFRLLITVFIMSYQMNNCNDHLHLKTTNQVPVHRVFLRGVGALHKVLLTPVCQNPLWKAVTWLENRQLRKPVTWTCWVRARPVLGSLGQRVCRCLQHYALLWEQGELTFCFILTYPREYVCVFVVVCYYNQFLHLWAYCFYDISYHTPVEESNFAASGCLRCFLNHEKLK